MGKATVFVMAWLGLGLGSTAWGARGSGPSRALDISSFREATVRSDAGAASRPAEDIDNPQLWNPRTTSVAVFKNGFGFFMRQGEVKLRDGWSLARQVPPAAFGTLAIYSHHSGEIVDVVSSGPGEVVEFDNRDAPDNLTTKTARLESCRNLKISLDYLQAGKKRSACGKLLGVGSEFAILESDSNSLAVPVAGITRLQITDLPVRAHVADEAGKSPASTTLGMAYLRSGITWIPEYTLKVVDDDTAELTLRATLVNEAEDLIHCDVNFVVGVPHFVHTDYLAPIAVGQMIRSVAASVAPPGLSNQIMNRAAITSNARAANQFGPEPEDRTESVDMRNLMGNLPQMDGPASSDYTVYTKKDLTVRRGEKAIVNLFVKRVKYSHLYRWSPPQAMQHFLLLQNGTDSAWTTGPFLATSHDQPLSEDLLKYTPRGGRCELPVTSAMNVAGDQSETEVDRKMKEHSPSKDYYLDLVTLKGELKIRSFEKAPIELIVQLNIPGKPVKASDQARLTVDTNKLKLTERAGAANWQIRLEPAQSKTLTYEYQRYVPSN
jgi:hypothetical protein